MYPLVDNATVSRKAAEGRRAAESSRTARDAQRRRVPQRRHRMRHAFGASLVRAGVRLINA